MNSLERGISHKPNLKHIQEAVFQAEERKQIQETVERNVKP